MKQHIIDRINRLENKYGYITPEIVLNDAIDQDSPLHAEFDWNNETAAHSYRVEQARKLIRSVKVVFTTDEITIKSVAYVRDPSKPKDEQGYLSVEKVRKDEDTARDVLINEFKHAGAALQRAQRLATVFGLEKEIDDMSKKLNRIRKDVEEYRLAG